MKLLSAYVHVPFCTRRCSYCSFYHVESSRESERRFVDALVAEIGAALGREPVALRTVYIGGGTPSVLGSVQLGRVFDALAPFMDRDQTLEVTCELNPEDVTPELAGFLRDRGVTRASLGVQSMQPIAQKVLKRCAPEVNERAIATVMAAFDNVNLDVLLGIPGSSRNELEATVKTLAERRPAHFSVYCLEPGGDMSHAVERFFTAVDPERSADEYLFVSDYLAAMGYRHYEVSNFGRPGFESLHNRVYWGGADYVGFGPAAHSCVDGRRYSNPAALGAYIAAGGAVEALRSYDEATADSARIERLMLAMRTADGVAVSELGNPSEAEALVERGLARIQRDTLCLTPRGFLLLNEIVLRLCGRPGAVVNDHVE